MRKTIAVGPGLTPGVFVVAQAAPVARSTYRLDPYPDLAEVVAVFDNRDDAVHAASRLRGYFVGLLANWGAAPLPRPGDRLVVTNEYPHGPMGLYPYTVVGLHANPPPPRGKCEICGMPAGHRLLNMNVCKQCLLTYQPECPACGGRMIGRRYGREIVFDCTRCDVRALKGLGHTGVNPPARDELLRWVQELQLSSPDWTPRRVLCTGVLPASDDSIFIETMVSIHTTRDSIAVGLWPDARDMPISDDAIYVDMPLSAEARRHLRGLYAWSERSDLPENLHRVADIGIDNAVAEAIACVSHVTLEREGAELRVTLSVGGAMDDREIFASEALGFNTDVFELTALIPLDAVADVLRASPMITIQVYPLVPRGVQANPRTRRPRREHGEV